jgi:hypothetical protein
VFVWRIQFLPIFTYSLCCPHVTVQEALCADAVTSAPEQSLPEDWDVGDLVQLHYRTPSKAHLQIKCLGVGDSVLVHWSSGAATGHNIHSVEVPTGDVLGPGDAGLGAYNLEKLPELINRFAAGLDLAISVRFLLPV